MEQGGIEELQKDAAALGKENLRVTFHPLAGETQINNEAARIGHILSLSEMDRLYADGGASYQRIGEKIQRAAEEFIASAGVEFRDFNVRAD